MPLPLETPRLILRPFEDCDIQPFAAYRSDPEVERYQGWFLPYTEKQAGMFVRLMKSIEPGEEGEWYQIAVGLKPSGDLIGDVAFKPLLEDRQQAEIGFTFARQHQGKGYAAEAVARLLDYLFFEQVLHRVRANCDPENTASIRLMTRLGMRHEGRFIESLWFKGRWADVDWYAILDREWQARPRP
jgi:RimJ/RimL family protein N-acetyltransferase